MNCLFEILPGVKMPVPEVTRQIATMWREEDGNGEYPASNAHALQMNLILHFGLATGEGEAKRIFEVAIQFSQRYPCRIIVLCPEKPTGEEIALDAKLYSQCFLGDEVHDRCCCEALVLGYGMNEATFLEDQLSIWLASDLPIYHWLHRIPGDLTERHYRHILGKARRVVFDSAVDGDAYDDLTWSRPETLSDLANVRTARLRQSLGQFLASTAPRVLVENLHEVTVSTRPSSKAEAQRLLVWQKTKLELCAIASRADLADVVFRLNELPENAVNVIESNWGYEGEKNLSWKLPDGSDVTWIEAVLDGRTSCHPARADPFQPAKALAEALFFN